MGLARDMFAQKIAVRERHSRDCAALRRIVQTILRRYAPFCTVPQRICAQPARKALGACTLFFYT